MLSRLTLIKQDEVHLDKFGDVHAVAGLMKTYLREVRLSYSLNQLESYLTLLSKKLPEALMTFEFYEKVINNNKGKGSSKLK